MRYQRVFRKAGRPVAEYSDATHQVLTLALDRLASDPMFSAEKLSALRLLVDAGRFHDMAELTAAIEQTTNSLDGSRSHGD